MVCHPAWTNECENVVEVHEDGGIVTKTKPEVIHVEANAIAKLAKGTESWNGSSDVPDPCSMPRLCQTNLYCLVSKRYILRIIIRMLTEYSSVQRCNVKIVNISPGEIQTLDK
jgi:hypothetical protein